MGLFGRLFMLPFLLGGPRSFGLIQAGLAWIAVLAAAVWLAAPFAIWKAFGAGWMAFWLIPTTLAVCGLGYSRKFEGGG